MLDALVHGQDRQVARARQAAVAEQGLQVAQDGHGPVGGGEHAVHEIGPGQVQLVLGDALAGVFEQRARVRAEQPFEVLDRVHGSP